MKKLLVKSAVLGASLLAMASAAQGADYEVNIYGASAQNAFWNDAADDFLRAPLTANGLECATVDQDRTTTKDGIARGTNCAGLPNPTDVILVRYSARASADGPRSVFGIDPDNTDPCDTMGFDDSFRLMADEASVDWDPATVAGSNKCVDVTIGASDVASSSFTQISEGNEEGFYQNGPYTRFDMNANPIPGVADGLEPAQPVVVPFAFFVNAPAAGWKDADGNPATQGDWVPDPASSFGTIENISRVQAVNVFGGRVYNWSQFGSAFPDKYVVACLRHAGSGTHASLDVNVFRGELDIAQKESWPVPFFSPNKPYIFFHISSSDLMRCVNYNGDGTAKAGMATDISTHLAIGYADADKNEPDAVSGLYGYPDAVRIKYNGVKPVKENITNGNYTFWTAQWLYQNPADPNYAKLKPIQDQMILFASDPANLPAKKAPFWAAASEMKVDKPKDTSLPIIR